MSVSETQQSSTLEQLSNSNNLIVILIKKLFAFLTNPSVWYKIRSKKKKIYLMLSPQYNNLGDHAIALASLQWLKETFEDYMIVEITSNYYKNFKSQFKKHLLKDDILFISGGGYMGDMWMTMENMVRDIMTCFPNKIVVLPQTIYFNSDIEYRNSLKIYRRKDAYFILRDYASYQLCKERMKLENVFYAPDIALLLKVPDYRRKKNGTMGVCLRKDAENVQGILSKEQISACAAEAGLRVKEINTLIKPPFIINYLRKNLVYNKIKEISRNDVVVTNRLHCMIFCYLSKTPCIAFDNKSKKLSGVYEWMDGCNYIKMYNNRLLEQISELLMLNPDLYIINEDNILKEYKSLQNSLLRFNSNARETP